MTELPSPQGVALAVSTSDVGEHGVVAPGIQRQVRPVPQLVVQDVADGATLPDNFGTMVQSVPDSNLNVTDTAVTRPPGNFALADAHDDATEYDTWWEGVTVTNCTAEDEALLYLRGEPDDLVHPRVGSATWRSRTIPAC